MTRGANGKTGKPRASVRQKVAHGAFLITAARSVSRALDLLTLMVLARLLTPADFGLVAIATSAVQLTEAMLELPTGNALLQLKSVGRKPLDTAFTFALLRGLFVAALLAGLSFPLANFFGDERLVPLICFLSVAPALRGLRSPRAFLLFKHLRFRPDATAEIFGKLAALCIAITLALETGSYWAIAAGSVANPLFYVIATYVLVPARPRFTLHSWRLFHRYLGWSIAAQGLSALNWQTDRFVLAKIASQTTVGLFATTRDIAAMPYKVIFESIQRPVISALSRSNGHRDRQGDTYRLTLSAVLSIGIPIAFAQAILAPQLVELVLGPQWLTVVLVFQAASLTLIPGLFSSMTSSLLYASGKPNLIFTRNLYDWAARMPLTVGLTLWGGWKGAVMAFVVSDCLLAFLCMMLVRRTVGISVFQQLAGAWRAAISGICMVGIMLVVGHSTEAGSGPLGIILYLLWMVPLAGSVYAVMLLVIWISIGRPDGIERLAFHFAEPLLPKTARRIVLGRS